MEKRSVLFSALFMAFFVVTVVTSGTAVAQKKPIILRLVVPSPAGEYPLTFVNTELARKFNERAKDEYKIEVHPGGALAKLPEYFDAVRIGAVEMACAPWPMYSYKTWDTEIEAEDVKTFKQKGVSIYLLPEVERERWVKAVTPYKEKQLTGLWEFGQKVAKIADEANKRYPYKE